MRPTACCPVSGKSCAQGSKRTTANGLNSCTPSWPTHASTNCAHCARTPRTARARQVTRAAQAVLGSTAVEVDADDALHRPRRRLAVGADVLQSAAGHLRRRGAGGRDHRPGGDLRSSPSTSRPRANPVRSVPPSQRVHGPDATKSGPATSPWTSSSTPPRWPLPLRSRLRHRRPKTVLLTGANGYLGRFLALDWLQRLAQTGGKLIAVVRGRDEAAARARLEAAFDSGDPDLLARFRALAAEHLEVIPGDIGEPNLGLDEADLAAVGAARRPDRAPRRPGQPRAALPKMFGPNVVGTAEVIRLAITARIKPVTYLSTVSVSMSVAADDFVEDGDIRDVSPVRARRRSLRQWLREQQVGRRGAAARGPRPLRPAGRGVPLRHDPGAHPFRRAAQRARRLHPADVSLLVTGIAPRSFYETDADGHPQRAHYHGLPADFVAESIITLAARPTDGFRSFDVMNPYDDGISLDIFVDWLIDAGHTITRIDHYQEWLGRFETALKALPERATPTQRAASAGRVPQAGEAATGRHCTDRGVPRRGSGGQDWRRPRHSPCLGVADREVRGRPTAP